MFKISKKYSQYDYNCIGMWILINVSKTHCCMKNDDLRWKDNIVFLLVFSSGQLPHVGSRFTLGWNRFSRKWYLVYTASFSQNIFLACSFLNPNFFFPNAILIVLVISKVLQILSLRPQFKKNLDHLNNFF